MSRVGADLGTRTLSAIVMVAVAAVAIWWGGWIFRAFAIAIGLGVLWEFWTLVRAMTVSIASRLVWMTGGCGYVGLAVLGLVGLRDAAPHDLLMLIAAVIAVDIGAYFAGRLIGGPKIAPRISPSKTWAGLGGAIFGAALVIAGFMIAGGAPAGAADIAFWAIVSGAIIAVVAQSGDFFESWMKRRAGVKDSGSLIPGHGGLFDRTDGLIAVAALVAVIKVWLF